VRHAGARSIRGRDRAPLRWIAAADRSRWFLLWDDRTETEDFIREARFDGADKTFGFVVPVPAEPTIAGVADPPFDRVRATVPFVEDLVRKYPMGMPRSVEGRAAPVAVLSEQRIGSFTAFTLSAHDSSAFQAWLAKNGFVMSAAQACLAHYVKLKFYFAAFRYEGSVDGRRTSRSGS
jgi:hypothetical protein